MKFSIGKEKKKRILQSYLFEGYVYFFLDTADDGLDVFEADVLGTSGWTVEVHMELYLHTCFFLLSGELMVPGDGVHFTKVFVIGGKGARKGFVVQEML